jgi:hypothetical protein
MQTEKSYLITRNVENLELVKYKFIREKVCSGILSRDSTSYLPSEFQKIGMGSSYSDFSLKFFIEAFYTLYSIILSFIKTNFVESLTIIIQIKDMWIPCKINPPSILQVATLNLTRLHKMQNMKATTIQHNLNFQRKFTFFPQL